MQSQSAWVAVVWAMAACGGGAGPSTNSSCTPGATATCPCADGTTGAQVCNRGGTFDACRCLAADSGVDAPRPMDAAGPDATSEDLGAPEVGVDAVAPPDLAAPPDVVAPDADVVLGPDVEPCPTGQTRCSGGCVDTQANPLHCSACDRACPAGQACDRGTCRAPAADCRMGGCPAMTYCDLGTGMCRPGCAEDAHCPATERCDFATRACVCGSGTHRCAGACVSDASPASCGASCTPCPAGLNGSPACEGGRCALACNAGFHACAGACVTNASVASCGARCEPCAPPANAQATCASERCDYACNVGFLRCEAGCCSVRRTTLPLGTSPRDVTISTATGEELDLYYAFLRGASIVQGHQVRPIAGSWATGVLSEALAANSFSRVVGATTRDNIRVVCGAGDNPAGSPVGWAVQCVRYASSLGLARGAAARGDAHGIGSVELAVSPTGAPSVLVREVARSGARSPTQWLALWGQTVTTSTLQPTGLISSGTPSTVFRTDLAATMFSASEGAPACLRAYTYTGGLYRASMVGAACEPATLVHAFSGSTQAPHVYATPTGSIRFVTHWADSSAVETVDGPSPAAITALHLTVSPAGSYQLVFTRSTSEVYYAVRTAAGWRVESISAALGGATGTSPSIAVDSRGRPHVVFLQGADPVEVTW